MCIRDRQTVGDVFPLLQQIQRYGAPIAAAIGGEEAVQTFGGPSRYGQRGLATTVGAYTGFPLIELTPEQRANTARGYIRDINDYMKSLENIGMFEVEGAAP